MLPEIALEAFRYFDRSSLEGLQMHSRYLRDLVNHNARTLPLRYIYEVEIEGGAACAYTLQEDNENYDVVALAAVDDDLTIVLHRLDNAFIHRLMVSFLEENLRFAHYIRANASELQCQIRTLHIDGSQEEQDGRAVGIDYDLLDFLGAHLKPQIYKSSIADVLREGCVMLLPHDALRSNVTHLVYEAFEMAERGNEVVRSVTLLHERWGTASPLIPTIDPLGPPRLVDVPTPRSAFLHGWYRSDHLRGFTATEAPISELFVFENWKLAKKLEVFTWTIEHVGRKAHALHTAFLFQCR
ncbi:hypothetical protein AAVH_20230 [Aphelenchoides avenae]|nr:hypothetical protein AAVH_20230 [Aphelenchus avenae]